MNGDEISSMIRKIFLTIFSGSTGAWLTNRGVDTTALAGVVATLATIGWDVYAHWNMKKVPETAKVS